MYNFFKKIIKLCEDTYKFFLKYGKVYAQVFPEY